MQVQSNGSKLMSVVLLQKILSYKLEFPKDGNMGFFGNNIEDLKKNFKTKDKETWSVSINDVQQIATMHGRTPFSVVRPMFVDFLNTQQLTLKNFAEVTYLGMKLFDSFAWPPDPRVSGNKVGAQNESYFSTYFTSFYSIMYGNPKCLIRKDAWLATKLYTDLVLYNSQNIQDCVVIEWAANIEIEDTTKDLKEDKHTIIEHINRLIHEYAGSEMIFYRDDGKDKWKKSKGSLSQLWFVYFDDDISVIKEVERIVTGTREYHQLNMILCQYTYNRSEFGNIVVVLEFHVKLMNEKTWTKWNF